MSLKLSWGGAFNGHKIYEKIISLENLLFAWNEFQAGKSGKADVQKFALNLEDNIFTLHKELLAETCRHGHYTSFYICDPKLRHINKATVKDRIVHHAIMRVIEVLFDKTFIFDSYSSRKDKGTHRAVKRLQKFAWRLSRNNTKTVWILKCDIKKFFDSVDHGVLLNLIKKKIHDEKVIKLIENIICSFNDTENKGIPLGNLTSQLFSNIYLNELDQFIKKNLREKYYIRYADDFVILGSNKLCLQNILIQIEEFLREELKLYLHERKVSIKEWHKGTDFLGYVVFPHHTILRTKTKRRILKKTRMRQLEVREGIISKEKFEQTRQSYYAVLKHCSAHQVKKYIESTVL